MSPTNGATRFLDIVRVGNMLPKHDFRELSTVSGAHFAIPPYRRILLNAGIPKDLERWSATGMNMESSAPLHLQLLPVELPASISGVGTL